MDAKCPASFWRFAGPVIMGNLAALGVGYMAKRMMPDAHPTTRTTIALLSANATFWIVGGFTWVAMHPKPKQLAQ